jgi:type II secretory pathway component PulF
MSTAAEIALGYGAIAYAPVAFSAFLILIGRRAGWFGTFASIVFTLYLVFLVLYFGGYGFVPFCFMILLPIGVLVYAYRRYRQGRQEEIFQVITSAVESNVPLAPALRAYLMDRPQDGRVLWDAGLLLLCPPGFPVWTQRRSFDDRVAQLSAMLSAGAPLADALRIARGVAPPEMTVAAEVGDTTGRLAVCLRRADRDRLAGAWIEVLPRILYPLLLLIFISGITTFLALSIVPKFKKIFDDFKMNLPPVTEWLIQAMMYIADFLSLVIAGIALAVALGILILGTPTIRWYVPIVGRLFRWEARGLVLRMLGLLFEVGRPAPEALGLLADAPDIPVVVHRRLYRAKWAVQNGRPLAEALYEAGLLQKNAIPLVNAAERTHTLPFALTELGDLLAGRAVRLARRLSLIVAPILILAIGLLVGFIVVGIFSPLIEILTRLSTE